MYGLRLQREYDDEDRALSVQRAQLANRSGLQDSLVRSLPHFRLELLLCLFYLPFLPSHLTQADTTSAPEVPSRRTSNATRFAHLRRPTPTGRRFDSRHSNVTYDVRDTSPVGPSLETTYFRT